MHTHKWTPHNDHAPNVLRTGTISYKYIWHGREWDPDTLLQIELSPEHKLNSRPRCAPAHCASIRTHTISPGASLSAPDYMPEMAHKMLCTGA